MDYSQIISNSYSSLKQEKCQNESLKNSFKNSSIPITYHDYFPEPFLLDQSRIAAVLNGYVIPVFVLLTVVTNTLVCLTLLRKELRNATNLLLVAMAVSDTFTGVFPTPMFLHFYTTGWYKEWVPYSSCFMYLSLTEYLPTITHTASIWLTVTLAFHRYICVCRGSYNFGKRTTAVFNNVKSSRNVPKTPGQFSARHIILIIIVIYVLATLTHINRFFELNFYSVTLKSLINSEKPDELTQTNRSLRTNISKNAASIFATSTFESRIYESTTTQLTVTSLPGIFTEEITKYIKSTTGNLFNGRHFSETGNLFNERNLSETSIPLTRHRFNRSGFYLRKIMKPFKKIDACEFDFVPLVKNNMTLYFSIYYWFRVFFIHIIPCISLVILNALLVRAMRTAARRTAQLRRENRGGVERRRLSESNSTTLMLSIVVTVMLLVELPLAVMFGITVLENTLKVLIISKESTQIGSLVVNGLILLSYSVNFFIYCATSRKFRHSFCLMFRRQVRVSAIGRSQSSWREAKTVNQPELKGASELRFDERGTTVKMSETFTTTTLQPRSPRFKFRFL